MEKLKRLRFFFLGLLLTLALTWPLFKSGYFTHHDDVQVIRLYELDKCIRDFQIPCRWVPDLGGLYGYPLFNYYAPLPYYFGETFYLISGSLPISVKIMFGFAFVGSYIFMYLFAAKLWKSKLAGAISGVFYAYAPYHAVDFYVRGAMGEMWALMLIPAVFWSSLRLFESKKLKYLLLNALFLALLAASHNLSLMMFLPFILGFGVLLTLKNKDKKTFLRFLFSILLGLALAAFYLLPAYFEKNLAHIDTTTMGYFSYTEHFKGLRKLLVERMWGWGASVREVPGGEKDGMSFQIGWAHLAGLVLALAGLAANFKKPLFKKYFWEIVFLLFALEIGIFMIHPDSLFVWKAISPLKYLQFPWRFLLLVIFSVSVISGSVVLCLKRSWLKLVIGLVLIAGVVALNFSYFRPEKFLEITQEQMLSGVNWDKQIKRSIFDYLPIYAKAPPAELADFNYKINSGEEDISNFQKGSNWFSFDSDIRTSATITVAQYYFPNWEVKIDKVRVPIDHNNDLGLISFRIESGSHSITAKLYNTPLRTFANLLTVFSALVFFCITFAKKK